jgi:hypothetical protein
MAEIDDMQHRSAAVALRRLTHPERDGIGVVADELSGLFKRLSLDTPKLMEEVVAFIERRTTEMSGDDCAAPRPTERAAPAAAAQDTVTLQDDDAGKTTITLLFDAQVLTRIDADAKRIGISRTAWLHVAADALLEGRR